MMRRPVARYRGRRPILLERRNEGARCVLYVPDAPQWEMDRLVKQGWRLCHRQPGRD